MMKTQSSSRNGAVEEQRQKEETGKKQRPLLRGWLHAISIPFLIHSGIDLIHRAPTKPIQYACMAYVVSATLQFSVSALYNAPTWDPETRAALRKVDHACIYFLIAATYTPFCVVASETYPSSLVLLAFMWTVAIFGFARCFLKKDAFKSKAVSSTTYILLGWCGSLAVVFGVFPSSVYRYLLFGGLWYSMGGIMYALHWPNPIRGIMEYHEVFHLCTIIANSMMYEAVLQAL